MQARRGREHGRSRRIALALMAAALAAVVATPLLAADYPTRTITWIVPSPPGGGTDTQARVLAPKLSEILGQSIVIDNRPGASGNIGAQAAAKATPDGYTILAMISSHVINPHVLKSMPYDLDRDFTMISRTVTVPGVLVGNPSLPAKTLPELLAYLKANPGKVAFGSGGTGSLSHLIVELFEQKTGTSLLHVPYRGTHPALTDAVSGQVALMVPDLTIAVEQIRSGRLRAFGVTSAKRSPVAPEIPTLAEAGLPGFDAVQWFGIAAPAGTPDTVVQTLHAAIVRALADPKVKAQYADLAMTTDPSPSPADYARFVRDEGRRWGKVVEDARLAPQ